MNGNDVDKINCNDNFDGECCDKIICNDNFDGECCRRRSRRRILILGLRLGLIFNEMIVVISR